MPDGRPQAPPQVSPHVNPQGSDVASTDQALAAADTIDAPPSAPETTDPRPYAKPIELIIIAAVVIVDQLTKEIVRRTLPLHGEPAQLIPGFLDLTHVQNTGAAFGLLNAADFPYKAAVMIGIACMALVAIATYATQLGFHERLALILGGAFGNLIDRALFGHVVDFVDVYWGAAHFWAFNVADASITVGAILVLLDMIGLGRRHASHPV
jgi:signal peptidase II